MIAALAAVVCLAVPATVPVEGRVVDWFRQPVCPRCAGNRGLELTATPDAQVVAPVAGEVTFAGPVGGIGYVVIAAEVVEGLNFVLGGLLARTVAVGDRVVSGVPVGRAGAWLFVGTRMGPRSDGRYLDPAPLFGLVRKSARLVAPDPVPVSLARRPGPQTGSHQLQRHCSVLPPVVASARGPGP